MAGHPPVPVDDWSHVYRPAHPQIVAGPSAHLQPIANPFAHPQSFAGPYNQATLYNPPLTPNVASTFIHASSFHPGAPATFDSFMDFGNDPYIGHPQAFQSYK